MFYKTSRTSRLAAAVVVAACMAWAEPVVFDDGDGSVDEPYVITTAEQLDAVRDDLSAHYKLGADINLGVEPWNEGEGWEPIGGYNYLDPLVLQFTGSLTNPDGYVISGLRINRPDDSSIGLFGAVSDNGTVSGILLADVNIIGNSSVGAVAGTAASGTTINNCVVTGTVSGTSGIGGVVGTTNGTVSDNVALLESVSGSNAARVVSSAAGGTLADNEAWSHMRVNGTTVTGASDHRNGADMSIAEAIDLLEDLGMTVPAYLGDGGTSDNPIIIIDAAGLDAIRNGLDKHYRLAADINLTFETGDEKGAFYNNGAGWSPIGTFTGSFDGNGFVILGLRINRTAELGLFSAIGNGGEVSGLLLENVSIEAYAGTVGGVAGENRGKIENCIVTGTVSGNNDNIGGVAGNNYGTIENCVVTGTVSGNNNIGGVVGTNLGTVENCVVTGTVSGGNRVGGVVGHNDAFASNNTALLESVSSEGDVGRVIGGGLDENNIQAWSGMTVIGTRYDYRLFDGEDMSTADAIALLETRGIDVPQYLLAARAAEVAAEVKKFKDDHEDILAKEVDEVNESDIAAIEAALDDYAKLSVAAKAELESEHTKLLAMRFKTTGILETDREVPAVGGEDVAVVNPVGNVDGVFSIGPSPVVIGGNVNFFWNGVHGKLRIFDANGNYIRQVSSRDGWDLKDAKGNAVSEGTYLVRGRLGGVMVWSLITVVR